MVTTPHFHRYDEIGRFIAYKTYELKQLGTTPIKIADGFKSFYSHLNTLVSGEKISDSV